MIIFDNKGLIDNANAATFEILAKEKDDVIGEYIEKLLPDIKNHYFSKETQSYFHDLNSNYEFEQIIEASNKKHLLISISKITDELNKESFFVFITDITQRKIAEKRLLDANDELEEFAYRTSHDLRSPIISATGLIRFARKHLNEKNMDKVHTCIDHAEQSLQKLDNLIKDILTLTKSQKCEEESQEVNVGSSINDIFDSFSQLEGAEIIVKNIDLQHTQILKTKKIRFDMILENLISNSIKYRDEKAQKSFIKIATYNEDENFILDFSDNGLGIPEEQTHKMFKMFNRLHPNISFGSGLGLYLTKKNAEFLGGEISYIAQSKGTMFRLRLPQ